MITPRFELKQSDNNVTVIIYAPYANIADTEVYVDDNDFRFFSSPYYLRLHLPRPVVETDSSQGSYDADEGKFVLVVDKKNQGENFPDLDLITSLLAPPKRKDNCVQSPSIEVVGVNNGVEDEQCNSEEDAEQEDGSEWFMEQHLAPEPQLSVDGPKYGFGNHASGVFKRFEGEPLYILDIPDPDSTPESERHSLRLEQERKDFSDDHYMADFAEQTEVVQPALDYITSWEKILREGVGAMELTVEDLDQMKDLPNKEYLLDKYAEQVAYLGLVDILAAYCYDHRTTEGDPTVESAWTINKLSSTLSWLENFSRLEDVLLAFVRRSLCYPLFRNWDLSVKVLRDVQSVLKLGKKQVLKCFLHIHRLFNKSEPRYILNQLYIQHYCIWVQKCNSSQLTFLAESLAQIPLKKEDIGFELVELETAVMLVQQEEPTAGVVKMTDALSSISLPSPQNSKPEEESVSNESISSKGGLFDSKMQEREEISNSDHESCGVESDLDSDDLTE